MRQGVNGTAAVLAATTLALVACKKAERPAEPPAGAGGAAIVARVGDGGGGAAAEPPTAERLREESARFLPEPYHKLWIGETASEVVLDYPETVPYASPGDPERLEWMEIREPSGLIVRLGFTPSPRETERKLRSVQFLSLLEAPVSGDGPPTPRTMAAWQQWYARAYAPHIEALRDKYGEKADVYSCAGGGEHPIVRIIWRGKALAITAAFLMHDKGLSSTLMVTPIEVAERYVQATRCRWMQDRVM